MNLKLTLETIATHQTKIDEKTKVDEANHRLYSSIFVHVRQYAQALFLKFQMCIYLISVQ